NVGFLIQSAGSTAAPLLELTHPLQSLRALLRSRLWLGGILLSSAGWGLQIAAFALAPLSLVQAFGSGGLALLVPLERRLLRRAVPRGEAGAVLLIAVALVLLSIDLGRPGSHRDFDDVGLTVYLAALAAIALPLIGLGVSDHARTLGAAAGLLYGASDVATKAVTGVADHGLDRVVGSVEGLILVAVVLGTTLVGFLVFQRGLQGDRPVPVIALMAAGTNVVTIFGGVIVFGDPLGGSPAVVALHVIAFVLVGLAGWLLAPLQDHSRRQGTAEAA
ncbi:MAG: hypothetical protein QOD76_1624, partial [Solirubrobacteraceae bacterium]|nr:hypothetical protein [Solirubrobacteraceae bacterium]